MMKFLKFMMKKRQSRLLATGDKHIHTIQLLEKVIEKLETATGPAEIREASQLLLQILTRYEEQSGEFIAQNRPPRVVNDNGNQNQQKQQQNNNPNNNGNNGHHGQKKYGNK